MIPARKPVAATEISPANLRQALEALNFRAK